MAIFGCVYASRLDHRIGSKGDRPAQPDRCCCSQRLGIISTGPGYTLFGLRAAVRRQTPAGFSALRRRRPISSIGLLVGLAFGPVQASSRSYLARSVSPEEAGRYFGIYALSGRATCFWRTPPSRLMTYASGSARIGMTALMVFLAAA